MSGRDVYEADLVLWSEQQARLLREAAARRTNEAIDFDNIAEEIETMGRSQAGAATDRLARIIEHLLKLQFSTARAPRRGWEETVRVQRLRLEIVLQDSPSLRARLAAMGPRAARLATAYAVESLTKHGEQDSLAAVRSHGGMYDIADVTGDWLPPAPHQG